jgi:hypothetical protein
MPRAIIRRSLRRRGGRAITRCDGASGRRPGKDRFWDHCHRLPDARTTASGLTPWNWSPQSYAGERLQAPWPRGPVLPGSAVFPRS